jgi:SAM-dependent methyltransferase
MLLFPYASWGRRVLDVGCGKGRFLAALAKLGWDAHGIEPDPVSSAIARETSGAVVHRRLDADLYPEGFFDVITMNHALEHASDPVALLQSCHRVAKADARLGIVVPNWRALGHLLFGHCWYALDAPRHLVMYEPRTLAEVVRRAGFTVESVRTTSLGIRRVTWMRNWRYRTGRTSPRWLTGAGALLISLAGAMGPLARGEQIVLWATRNPAARL